MASLGSKFPVAILTAGALAAFNGCTSTTASNSAAPDPVERSLLGGVPLIAAEKVATLTRSMPASRVVELLGWPERVNHINAPNVRAEVWVYRISRRETVAQVEVGQREVSLGGQISNSIPPPPIPIYRNETTRVYQTIELLMINDRLELQKPGRPEVETTYL